MPPDQQRKRLRRPVRQRQRLRLRQRQRAVRPRGAAHGHSRCAAQHLSLQHPGPADLVRGAYLRKPAISAPRGGTDLMVAMNPQTWDKDVAGIEPGGYLLLRSAPSRCRRRNSAMTSRSSACRSPRSAIANTPIRASASCSRTSSMSARSRRCSTWMSRVVEQLIGEQFKGKEKLIDAQHACATSRPRLGGDESCNARSGCGCKRANAVGDRIFIEGNSAAALGAVYGGATVCAWYPITPSSSLADAFTRHCQRLRVDADTKQSQDTPSSRPRMSSPRSAS